MSILKILTYPDPVLKEKSKSVEFIDEKIKKLAEDMIETMYAAPGIGLAAPQVGESLRVITVDVTRKGEDLIVLINPEIISGEGECAEEEGCLSVPGVFGMVKRHRKVKVEALDKEGKKTTIIGEGLLARVLQHEIDHINGILFTDKLVSKTRENKRY